MYAVNYNSSIVLIYYNYILNHVYNLHVPNAVFLIVCAKYFTSPLCINKLYTFYT